MGLTDAQIEGLREQLLGKKRELVEALEELNEQIAMKQDCSITDAGEAASLRELAARASGIAEQHERTVRAIDGALTRMDDGTYGTCTKTGEPIPFERLRLIPWAHTR